MYVVNKSRLLNLPGGNIDITGLHMSYEKQHLNMIIISLS